MAGVQELESTPESPAVALWFHEPPPARVAGARRFSEPGAYLAAMIALAALVPARGIWACCVLLLVALLTLPGLIMLRALRIPTFAIAAFPIYVPGASLAMLLAAALGVDLVAPPLGVAHPLRTTPLLVGIELVCLIGVGIGMRLPLRGESRPKAPQMRARSAWPLLLPLASAAGATLLTSGHGRAVAVIALGAVSATLLVVTIAAPRMSLGAIGVVVYSVALAAMWSFSLRGHFVYGFDISAEQHIVESTFATGSWRPSQSHDAYRAMLSLTVLPSVLHAVGGVSFLTMLKAVFPALFALFPVAIFLLAARFTDRRWAFVAAAFLVTQTYFFQQMPGVARQEIGLLMFVVLVAALLETRVPRTPHALLIATLAAGVVVCHYSTAYVGLALLAGACLLQLIVSLFRPVARVNLPVLVALLSMAVAAAAWYGPVTHSTSNVDSFGTSVTHNGFDLLPNREGGNPISSYLLGNSSRALSASAYAGLQAQHYREQRPFIRPLAAASLPRYAVAPARVTGFRPRFGPLSSLIGDGALLVAQIFNLLAALSVVILALRRNEQPAQRVVGFLGVAALGVLVLIRLSGTASNAYNQERAFVQTMIPLAIAIAALLATASRRWPRQTSIAAMLVGASLGVTFVANCGLRNVLTGGQASVNLASAGEDYDRFYTSAAELAAANRTTSIPPGALLYADRYGALRILAATGRSKGLFQDVTPRTLDRHAWVYSTRANTDGRARATLASRYVLYQWPKRYLDDYFATVYTNGTSSIYHR